MRGVGDRLRSAHGVPTVLYVGVAELAQAHVDAAGDLRLGDHAVSLVYSRFDFSHPFGAHQAQAEEGEEGAVWREWAVVEAMECSRAVMSSSLSSRLAHRRLAHY